MSVSHSAQNFTDRKKNTHTRTPPHRTSLLYIQLKAARPVHVVVILAISTPLCERRRRLKPRLYSAHRSHLQRLWDDSPCPLSTALVPGGEAGTTQRAMARHALKHKPPRFGRPPASEHAGPARPSRPLPGSQVAPAARMHTPDDSSACRQRRCRLTSTAAARSGPPAGCTGGREQRRADGELCAGAMEPVRQRKQRAPGQEKRRPSLRREKERG